MSKHYTHDDTDTDIMSELILNVIPFLETMLTVFTNTALTVNRDFPQTFPQKFTYNQLPNDVKGIHILGLCVLILKGGHHYSVPLNILSSVNKV